MACALAIDQSTSATKVALFDGLGTLIDKVSSEHAQIYPQPGWVEHDANEIWSNVLSGATALLNRHAALASDVALVSIANQRETIVPFDRLTGKPLHNAIVWQCRRGDGLCEDQVSAGRGEIIRSRTGIRVDGYFSASKLQWLMRHVEPVARAVAKGDAVFGTMDTYLIHRLTRGRVFATDATNASRTLLYDTRRLIWDQELCAWWEVPHHALAEVRDCDAGFGMTDVGGLLKRAVPIRGVMGDSQAALFGHGCLLPGAAKATLGTGASVLLNAGGKMPCNLSGAVAALAWVRDGIPTYAVEGIVNSAASSLTWLKNQMGIELALDEISLSVNEPPPNTRAYMVPAFSGLGAPHWRPDARAAIVGLSIHHDRRDVVKAALEAIAYQLCDVLQMLSSETGIRLTKLHCDGGSTANPQLMQFMADLLGVELSVAIQPDRSARGATLMGLMGEGLLTPNGALAPNEIVKFERRCESVEADAVFAGWRAAVNQVVSR